MRREDVHDLIRRVPAHEIAQVVFVVRGAPSISIDMVYRFEPEYLVVRGRESGTNDDGRGFFIPYAEILYMKIERAIKLSDFKKMYGEAYDERDDDRLAAMANENDPRAATPQQPRADVATRTPTPSAALDPAAIAKQNLLDRIRAARTSAGGSGGGRPTFG